MRPAEADEILAVLQARPDWEQLSSVFFGRRVALPRLTAWWGDPGARYRYSGITHVASGWPPVVRDLRDRLEAELGPCFNSVLANRYRDGRDTMGWHADDERELGESPVIASLSFGAARRFSLRHRTRNETVDLVLEHGSLLLMEGATQRGWRHRLPRAARCREERINLTFRSVTTIDPPT